jgi:ketosteroid isomerase-like protein
MSQERVEIAREGIEAWNRHDFEMGMRHLAPDVEWVPASPAAVERSVYRGHDEVRRGFDAIWDTWDVFELEEREIRDLGDSVLWLGIVHMRGSTSGVELDQEFANHLVFAGEQVVRVQGFRSWQDALDATGAGSS